ncbi:class A beta-lactamase [Streptomyces clavuligerus]|uniref:class A beta-lactamase n=1 Tax=Streptomyces clavuligerus TaxID=1901 RepID=UPI00017FF420|nr:class A beta-lactamase [Streptomyces clavuligerus]ANW21843.1 class A beta-lactamase [Streptomyces clavuligerus]EDY47102.1 beta-lactamase [Streptomyces clavuligerus]WDN54016.1 class A beta-lactamase [Streptomyces clavuligerus]
MRAGAVRPSAVSRRALLTAAALLPLAGCGTRERTGSPPASVRAAGRGSPGAEGRARVADLAALEREHGARLGVYALETGTGAEVAHRADERFAFCSTFKALAAAAVLHHHPIRHLERRVTWTRADVDSISPVTEDHIATGLTVGQLCDAAIRHSDGTAGNLLMRDLGGPSRLTAYLRGLGDSVSRMDQYEPELNHDPPHDPRDTTTPRAIASDYRKLVLGDALTPDRRALLTDWLVRNTTGGRRIRAGVPSGWRVADKTGTGNYGRANDIAVLWPPRSSPLVVAVMSDRPGFRTPPSERLIAEAAERIVAGLVRHPPTHASGAGAPSRHPGP